MTPKPNPRHRDTPRRPTKPQSWEGKQARERKWETYMPYVYDLRGTGASPLSSISTRGARMGRIHTFGGEG